jgi:formate hydrogenlyase subunit 3/multisubunit Na+/H+ antiporter MnhD subunit
MLLIAFTLFFGFISLVMLTANDHGRENTSCIKNIQCIKVLNGVILTLVFSILLVVSPYFLRVFLSKNVSLVLTVLFAMVMLIGACIAVGVMIDVSSSSTTRDDSQTRAMQAMTYIMGFFGIMGSCAKLLHLGSDVEKLFKK